LDFKELIPSRYRVTYDEKTGAFWILDCWHETIKNIPEVELAKTNIPTDSPALTIISTEQANALIGEQIRLGWFENMKSRAEESKPQAPVMVPASLEELAITKITEIAKQETIKEDVAKQAITAVRELGFRQMR
jgi:hypothetical protein